MSGMFAPMLGPWAGSIGTREAINQMIRSGAYQARAPSSRRLLTSTAPKGTAVVSLIGIFEQRPGLLSGFGLGVSTDQVGEQIRSAIADSSVRRIVLDIDSQGGEIAGVQELADLIFESTKKKPIVGVANAIATGGAFWLLAQCTEAYCTPSGVVGGVGIVDTYVDNSEAMQKAGINRTLIASTPHKAEGQHGPLPAEGIAARQAMVDSYGADFVRAVARGRMVSTAEVERSFGQGRSLRATSARTARMVDGIRTLDQVLTQLLAVRAAPAALATAGAVDRYAHLPPRKAAAMRELDALL